jgi:hypothetical protein
MEHMAISWKFDRQLEGAAFEAFCIALRPFSAHVSPFCDVFEFCAQNTGMDIIEAAVEAE